MGSVGRNTSPSISRATSASAVIVQGFHFRKVQINPQSPQRIRCGKPRNNFISHQNGVGQPYHVMGHTAHKTIRRSVEQYHANALPVWLPSKSNRGLTKGSGTRLRRQGQRQPSISISNPCPYLVVIEDREADNSTPTDHHYYHRAQLRFIRKDAYRSKVPPNTADASHTPSKVAAPLPVTKRGTLRAHGSSASQTRMC